MTFTAPLASSWWRKSVGKPPPLNWRHVRRIAPVRSASGGTTGVLSPLTVHAEGRLRTGLQALARDLFAALLAYPVGSPVASPHGRFHLGGLAVQKLLSRLL